MPNARGNTPSAPDVASIRERIKRRLEKPFGGNATGSADTKDTIEEQIALLQQLPQATLDTGNIYKAPPPASVKRPFKTLTVHSLSLTNSMQTAARELEKYGELLRSAMKDAQLTSEDKEALDRLLQENTHSLNNLRTTIEQLRTQLHTERSERATSIVRRFTKWFMGLRPRMKNWT